MNYGALIAVLAPGGLLGYAYVGYPLLLRLASRRRGEQKPAVVPRTWPRITIVIAAYNAERTIARTLEPLLRIDYPKSLVQILVASDGSTDGTDAIVRSYAHRGVELVLVPRGGKTAAENALGPHVRGEIVVCTDASVIVHPNAVKQLVKRIMSNPRLGVVSGRSIVVDPAKAVTPISSTPFGRWKRNLARSSVRPAASMRSAPSFLPFRCRRRLREIWHVRWWPWSRAIDRRRKTMQRALLDRPRRCVANIVGRCAR
jgi:cellulose synthase/poly-beta-1,6-N-acetylglucosamine synthase-like glycosyltransferase